MSAQSPTRMYTVTKAITFDSAHSLPSLPPDHQCSHTHGHTYRVEITLASANLDEHGMVLDFTIFKQLKALLDHKNLNDVFDATGAGPTTSENLCKFVWEWTDAVLWKMLGADGRKEIQIMRVSASETDSSSAELSAI